MLASKSLPTCRSPPWRGSSQSAPPRSESSAYDRHWHLISKWEVYEELFEEAGDWPFSRWCWCWWEVRDPGRTGAETGQPGVTTCWPRTRKKLLEGEWSWEIWGLLFDDHLLWSLAKNITHIINPGKIYISWRSDIRNINAATKASIRATLKCWSLHCYCSGASSPWCARRRNSRRLSAECRIWGEEGFTIIVKQIHNKLWFYEWF